MSSQGCPLLPTPSDAGIPISKREFPSLGPFSLINLHRRHLTASQKAAIAAEALPHFEEEAKKRQGARNDIKEKVPESSGQSRDHAAAQVGVNPRYVSDAKKIKEASPETFEKLRAERKVILAA